MLMLAAWPLGSAAEEPLQLGSEHIGMTAETMSETGTPIPAADTAGSAPGPTAGREATPATPTEWANGADAADPWAPAESAAPGSPAATSYEACVELAIQAGNGFRAASGVCQALFPEPVAPSQAARQSAPAEAPVQVGPEQTEPLQAAPVKEAPKAAGPPADDGPLVLTLDGPAPSIGGSEAGD